MLKVNSKLSDCLKNFNNRVYERYDFNGILCKNLLVNLIEKNINKIRQVQRFVDNEIKESIGFKGIVGVDGSINTIGSTYPHYLSLLQSVAKYTSNNGNIIEADIHSPLLENEKEIDVPDGLAKQESDDRQRAAKLAKLELGVAVKSIECFKPSVILMDGSLMRYRIYCGNTWDEFKELALQNKVYVAGIIEEIKTNAIATALKENIPEDIYDREILFGLLEYGQVLILKDWGNEDDIRKCFMRSSKDPHVIGVDMFKEQEDKMEEMARLVLTLTPENSRGIPLWLDIVDSEVKISDKMMKALVETYIDPRIRNMLLVAKRDNRAI